MNDSNSNTPLGSKSSSYWLAWLGAGFVPLLTAVVLLSFGKYIWAGVFGAIVVISTAAYYSVTSKLRKQNAQLDRVLTTVDKYSTAAVFRLYLLAMTIWGAITLIERDEHGWAGATLLVGMGLSMYFHILNVKKFARYLDTLRKEADLAKQLKHDHDHGQNP